MILTMVGGRLAGSYLYTESMILTVVGGRLAGSVFVHWVYDSDNGRGSPCWVSICTLSL